MLGAQLLEPFVDARLWKLDEPGRAKLLGSEKSQDRTGGDAVRALGKSDGVHLSVSDVVEDGGWMDAGELGHFRGRVEGTLEP